MEGSSTHLDVLRQALVVKAKPKYSMQYINPKKGKEMRWGWRNEQRKKWRQHEVKERIDGYKREQWLVQRQSFFASLYTRQNRFSGRSRIVSKFFARGCTDGRQIEISATFYCMLGVYEDVEPSSMTYEASKMKLNYPKTKRASWSCLSYVQESIK